MKLNPKAPGHRAVRWPFHAMMVSKDSHPSEERPGLRENFVAKVLLRRTLARKTALHKALGLTGWLY